MPFDPHAIKYLLREGYRENKFFNFLLVLLLITLVIIIIGSLNNRTASELPSSAREDGKYEVLVPGVLIVKLTPAAPEDYANQIEQKYNIRVMKRMSRNVYVVEVPKGEENILLEKLERDPYVGYAEQNVYNYGQATPNDPDYNNQYHLPKVKAPEAWDKSKGNGVLVAVLDSGIDTSHPDLGSKIIESRNFAGNYSRYGINSSNTHEDKFGHGTHTAGIVAAVTDNGKGVASGCPECKILNGKVLNDDNRGTQDVLAEGIDWAASKGAKVINISISGSELQVLQEAINAAWNKGIVIVTAAGNCGDENHSLNGCPQRNQKMYPAGYDNVITVASTDSSDKKSSFSNYGSYVDVAAPGSDILSTEPTYDYVLKQRTGSLNYGKLSGTSQAAPLVAAQAALLIASGVNSAQEVRNKIENTADKIAGTGEYWAKGRVNFAASLGNGNQNPTGSQPTPSGITDKPRPSREPRPSRNPRATKTPTPSGPFVCLGEPCPGPSNGPRGVTGYPPGVTIRANPGVTIVVGGPGKNNNTNNPRVTGQPGSNQPGKNRTPDTQDIMRQVQERLQQIRQQIQEQLEQVRQRIAETMAHVQNMIHNATRPNTHR
jgi:thermitase